MDRLRELERRAQLDPTSTSARIELLANRARVEGPRVYLEVLRNRETWNAAPMMVQNFAACEVLLRFDDVFKMSWNTWDCVNASRGENEVSIRSKMFSHRLATFTHIATGIEFQLLPGNRGPVFPWDEGGFPGLDQSIEPFLIARWPVTKSQASALEYHTLDTGDEPQANITYKMASFHLAKIGARLPTAQEWEYACKAGTTTRYYWGDEFDQSHVWYAQNSGLREVDRKMLPHLRPGHRDPRPHAPKEHDVERQYNAFGLVDMIGNVWEWCDGERALGGCYEDGEPQLRSVNSGVLAGLLDDSIGFRAAMSIPGIEI